MDPNEGFIRTNDGVRLYFRILGAGAKPVVFPNGFYLIDDFKQLADGRRLIFYDVRNRGKSDAVSDAGKLKRGIHNDVDDLEVVRRHFGIGKLDVIGHSYMGLMVALYAMKYPEHASRAVQIGPAEPEQGKQYPENLTWRDAAGAELMEKLGKLMEQHSSGDPLEACRNFWAVFRAFFVLNPSDAQRIDWDRCELLNERNFAKYWTGYIVPSLQSLKLTDEDFAKAQAPILTIHGRKDRSAAYGGGREWALRLPNARLVTVEEAAHAPWVENPELVFDSIAAFLDGAWPEAAEKVRSLELHA